MYPKLFVRCSPWKLNSPSIVNINCILSDLKAHLFRSWTHLIRCNTIYKRRFVRLPACSIRNVPAFVRLREITRCLSLSFAKGDMVCIVFASPVVQLKTWMNRWRQSVRPIVLITLRKDAAVIHKKKNLSRMYAYMYLMHFGFDRRTISISDMCIIKYECCAIFNVYQTLNKIIFQSDCTFEIIYKRLHFLQYPLDILPLLFYVSVGLKLLHMYIYPSSYSVI